MRLTTLFILITALHLSAKTTAQKVTMSFSDITISQFFDQLSKQTGFSFLLEDGTVSIDQKIDVHVTQMSLEKVLDQILKPLSLSYSIDQKMVMIHKTTTPVGGSIAPPAPIHGKVLDEEGKPLAGASVTVKGGKNSGITDAEGVFTLNAEVGQTLIISYVGFGKVGIKITSATTAVVLSSDRQQSSSGTDDDANTTSGRSNRSSVPDKSTGTEGSGASRSLNVGSTLISGSIGFIITLSRKNNSLGNVTVVYSNGYQSIPKDRSTGSFDFLNNELINRSVSTDVLSRIDGVASGVLFNKNIDPAANESAISIRGRSTIFANPQPLIVVDNFPYDGDVNNINPNDVESISILKDAAAASIWGARSGNGVIVITTKHGALNQKPKVSLNSNVTVGQKPDLKYLPSMTSPDYIGMEQFLFGQGYFDGIIGNGYSPLSPVVDILNQQRNGTLSQQDAMAALNQLKTQDVRNDLSKYFYQHPVSQQYAANVSGGTATDHYYFSAGIDKSAATLIRNGYQRATINANNTYSLIPDKLEVSTDVVFTSSLTRNDNTGSVGVSYPYAKVADASGKPLPIYKNYSKAYIDTAGEGLLLNWQYFPLDELKLADNNTSLTEYRLLAGIKYKIQKELAFSLSYQYTNGSSSQKNLQSQDAYYTRDLINQFTQADYSTGNLYYPVPLGGILDESGYSYASHNLRAQLNYNRRWNAVHSVSAIGGAELKSLSTFTSNSRLYGYDAANASSVNVDYVDYFYTNPYGNYTSLPTNSMQLGTTDHFFSEYINTSYAYDNKYSISASARSDASNLFGVNTNQKAVPLWSAGLAWELSKEAFYNCKPIPFMKVRVTEGYNGNVNKNVSAYTTAVFLGTNIFNANYSNIVNPPDPSLRWEKINIMNVAVDFASKGKMIEGTLEYYHKNGQNIIGNSPLAPQTGVSQFTGNTAGIRGNGIDFTINAKISDHQLKWKAGFLFSYASTIVSSYRLKQPAPAYYVSGNYTNPFEGKPYSSLFSFKWAGLDPQTGDPMGYVSGHASKDYASLVNPSSTDDIVFSGTTAPKYFGSLLNSFACRRLSLSFNITYKLGYVFRRSSVNYSALYGAALEFGSMGHSDFEKRWQAPGDEQHTVVPSMVYPADPARDEFYLYSTALVERGDQIRLQDCQISYSFALKKLQIKSMKAYLYANNLCILWRANKEHIDPDFVSTLPNPKTLSLGVKIDF